MKDDLRYVGALFVVCTLLLGMYKLGQRDGQDDAAREWGLRVAAALNASPGWTCACVPPEVPR